MMISWLRPIPEEVKECLNGTKVPKVKTNFNFKL